MKLDSNNGQSYVTILNVNNDKMELSNGDPYVTVVALEGEGGGVNGVPDCSDAPFSRTHVQEEIVMYRLPGERLGMGLKFEGGMQAAETISNVYIQSVALDSPAHRTPTAWNGLTEGDEILEIDGRKVNEMTRVDCVTVLKKAPVAIKLTILHCLKAANNSNCNKTNKSLRQNVSMKAPVVSPPPPPPVPPRKIRLRKESTSSEVSSCVCDGVQNDEDRLAGHLNVTSTGWEESSDINATDVPVPAGISVDLISEEDRRSLFNEYESDDTGSTVSTVIERPPEAQLLHTMPMSIKRVIDNPIIDLSPFEQLETEMESDVVLKTFMNDFKLAPVADVTKNQNIDHVSIVEPPEHFKDPSKNFGTYISDLRTHAAVQPAYEDSDTIPLPRPKTMPPPVPPRKLKLSRSSSLPSDDFEDHVMPGYNYPIVGNLLQELELLPEFPRAHYRTENFCAIDETAVSKDELILPAPSFPSLSCTETIMYILPRDTASSCYQPPTAISEIAANCRDDSVFTDRYGGDPFDLQNKIAGTVSTISIPLDEQFTMTTDAKSSDSEPVQRLDGENVNTTPAVGASSSSDGVDLDVVDKCEVVAVVKKPSPTMTSTSSSSSSSNETSSSSSSTLLFGLTSGPTKMASSASVSPMCDLLLDFSESVDNSPALFSRLPPDGHEFPSNYEEPDAVFTPSPVPSAPSASSPKDLMTFDAQVIEPPCGFEDNESSSSSYSPMIYKKSVNLGDLNSKAHVLDTSPCDVVDDCPGDDAPSTPLPCLSFECVSESSDSSHEDTKSVVTPSLPCKMNSSPYKPQVPEKPRGKVLQQQNEKQLSVKDKIALFSKAEASFGQQQQPIAPKCTSPKRSFVAASARFSVGHADPLDVPNPSTLPSNLIESIDDHYESHPRPSSSLSASSEFSKSSDDLLSQDSDLLSGFHHRSMYSILESRKKNVTKLKGLVIPQKPDIQQVHESPVSPDLPLIFSADSIRLPKVEPRISERVPVDHVISPPTLIASMQMNKNLDVPTYSPAFKRKTFTLLQSDREASKSAAAVSQQPPPLPKTTPPPPPPPVVPVMEILERLPKYAEDDDDGVDYNSAMLDDYHQDAEDQESGISSIESPNVSIHNTPPDSPKELHLARLAFSASSERGAVGYDKSRPSKAFRKTSLPSKGEMGVGYSFATSSQEEMTLDVRILKANSVEAINRRNVLQSSRSRCGGAIMESGSRRSTSQVDDQIDSSAQHDRCVHRRQKSLDALDIKSDDQAVEHDESSVTDLTDGMSSQPAKTRTVSDERWSELAKKYGKSAETKISTIPSFRRPSFQESECLAVAGTDKATVGQRMTRARDDINSSKLHIASTVPKTHDKCRTLPNGISLNDIYSDWGPVNMREKKPDTTAVRPASLVETDSGKLKLWDHTFGDRVKLAKSETNRGSNDSSVRTVSSVPSATFVQKPTSAPLHEGFNGRSRKSTSFNDLRLIFENQAMTLPSRKPLASRESRNSLHGRNVPNHMRMSSLDSTASDSDVGTPVHYGSANSLGSAALDHYGSITSLASSTSLISPQELQQLIDEANQSLEESGTPSHEITVVVLQREIPGGSIGITLAGGADYDCKEITVNKVISGSLADRDSRIQKGDRVLSINGKNLKGVTHREALCILKAPRTDCVLVLSRSKSSSCAQELKENGAKVHQNANGHAKNNLMKASGARHSPPVNSQVVPASRIMPSSVVNSRISAEIIKDGTGLGFSLEGGKDSPLGDRPLTIKKIFTGGAAGKNSSLSVGDEVLSINGTDVTKMARIEAWNFMRKLPDGMVKLVINHAE